MILIAYNTANNTKSGSKRQKRTLTNCSMANLPMGVKTFKVKKESLRDMFAWRGGLLPKPKNLRENNHMVSF